MTREMKDAMEKVAEMRDRITMIDNEIKTLRGDRKESEALLDEAILKALDIAKNEPLDPR